MFLPFPYFSYRHQWPSLATNVPPFFCAFWPAYYTHNLWDCIVSTAAHFRNGRFAIPNYLELDLELFLIIWNRDCSWILQINTSVHPYRYIFLTIFKCWACLFFRFLSGNVHDVITFSTSFIFFPKYLWGIHIFGRHYIVNSIVLLLDVLYQTVLFFVNTHFASWQTSSNSAFRHTQSIIIAFGL